jgi:transposase
MPRPYSNDLRERVVLAVRSGETCRAVAKRFGVSVSSVVKWSQRERATGSVAPARMGGYRRPVLEPYRDFIIEQIGRTPHLTLHALQVLLAARGIEGFAPYGLDVPAARGAAFRPTRRCCFSRPGTSRAGP